MIFADVIGSRYVNSLVGYLNKTKRYDLPYEAKAKYDYDLATRCIGTTISIRESAKINELYDNVPYYNYEVLQYALYCMLRDHVNGRWDFSPNKIEKGKKDKVFTVRVTNRLMTMISEIANIMHGHLIRELAKYIIQNFDRLSQVMNEIHKREVNIDDIDDINISEEFFKIANSHSLKENIIRVNIMCMLFSKVTGKNNNFSPDKYYKKPPEYSMKNLHEHEVAPEKKDDVENTEVIVVAGHEEENKEMEDDITMEQMVAKLFDRKNCYISESEANFITELIEKVGHNKISIADLKSIIKRRL